MNPALARLGLGPEARAVIIHADDLGMCHATIGAAADLWEAGLALSAAAMAPCPWFPRAAALCREHPEADVGVHLTLTCEWDAYRWGPLSTRDPASGLLDADGCFPRGNAAVWERADAAAAETELRAQIARADSEGMDITHLDTHMGTLAHPRFAEAYAGLGRRLRLPLLVPRFDPTAPQAGDPALAEIRRELGEELEAAEWPMFDRITGMPLDEHEHRVERAKRLFDGLPPGLSLVILHPARDTPELREIAADWRARVADREAFASAELAAHVRETGLRVLTYRELRGTIAPYTDSG